MKFLDRLDELARLEQLTKRSEGGLAVVYGRRRVGKTRLLLEWVRRHDGVYFVADQSSPDQQRAALATALARRLPAFADVTYPSWRALFERLSAEATSRRYRGPLVLDELPYLVGTSPELPSVLQAWIDHGVREARLAVALAGSSQRMMQGLVLDAATPLFGRATTLFEVRPLGPRWMATAFPGLGAWDRLVLWTAFGGVPRYWELAAEERGGVEQRIERLVLDGGGPLHQEPDRLLLEEQPSAIELRPLLEAVGAGARRVTEIAGRIGRPVTAVSRPVERLLGLGLLRREVPFGESPRDSKRSLYRLADPFLRLWFRLVAPRRGLLLSSSLRERRRVLDAQLPHLVAAAWEELARAAVPRLGEAGRFGPSTEWQQASRWWQGSAPEWDVVSATGDSRNLLLGEAKAWARPATLAAVRAAARALKERAPPPLRLSPRTTSWVLFVPRLAAGVHAVVDDVRVVSADELLAQ